MKKALVWSALFFIICLTENMPCGNMQLADMLRGVSGVACGSLLATCSGLGNLLADYVSAFFMCTILSWRIIIPPLQARKKDTKLCLNFCIGFPHTPFLPVSFSFSVPLSFHIIIISYLYRIFIVSISYRYDW